MDLDTLMISHQALFNIAFLNNTCKNVSSKIREMENRTSEYEIGERLICREYTVNDKHVFNVNFQYDIVLVLDEGLLLKNVKDGKLHPLPLDKARSSFSLHLVLLRTLHRDAV